jgi:RND family efflux transporter MFP subunit
MIKFTPNCLLKIAVPAAFMLLLAGCGQQDGVAKASSPTTGMTVSVAHVSQAIVNERVAVLGSVNAWEEIILAARSSGLAVVEVLVTENEHVNRGDVLVRLDDRILNAQIAQQRAVIEEAQANQEAALQKAARANVLVLTQAISKESAEDQRTSVKTSKATLDQAKAVLEQLQAQLDQTRIVSPADGYVSQKPVVLGTVVQTGTELVRLIRDSRLEIEAKVPENELSAVRAGQIAYVGEPAGKEIETDVRAVAAKVDPRTRLGIVYVRLPALSSFKPGMFARININVADRQALTVPEAALVWRADQPAVFVVDVAGRANLTDVATGVRIAGMVEIRSGLGSGDRVVVSGAGFLNDGDTVSVAVADGQPNAPEQIR